MNDQVLDEEPTIKSRYADFKVHLDSDMAQGTLQTTLIPTDNQILQPLDCMYNFPYTDGALASAEWVYSDIQIPTDGGASAPESYKLHIVGDDLGGADQSMSLIRGYAQSRSRPINTGDPNVPGDGGWMNDLFDVADNLDEIRQDITADNDRPPYPVEDSASAETCYPGGRHYSTEVVGYASFGSSSTQSVFQRSIKGGMFPCGLIEVKAELDGPSFFDIIVHLVPGTHRGYLCEPMEDV